jgi:ferredoxin
MCAIGAPTAFELTDDDEPKGHPLFSEVPPGEEVAVVRAVRSCPESAIVVED